MNHDRIKIKKNDLLLVKLNIIFEICKTSINKKNKCDSFYVVCNTISMFQSLNHAINQSLLQ